MKDEKKNKKKNYIKEFLPYVIIILAVILIKSFIVSPIRVNGVSMNPTLHNGDIMLLDEISYRFQNIKRFDIVVVHYEDEYLIKRVIGLPGEEIHYEDDNLYINDQYIEEDFTHKKTGSFSNITLGDNEYFVMGDNRSNSTDSRIIGPIKENQIIGKTNLTIFPFSRFGNKE